MAIDSPATIAILGAGPIGLEAALYARFLGYQVQLLERGSVAENVRAWGHVKLFSPFRMNRSPLGLAALAAQYAQWQPPDDDALLTGREFAQQYLLPLSQTDLLADCIDEHTQVVAIGRAGLLKSELVGDLHRAEAPFRVLVRGRNDGERFVTADIVVDATGTYGNHGWAGQGGVPALGELDAAPGIAYDLPD
ncbi:MAG: FAD-dependent oxidoreductase, partial [Planctomycetota bacterium]|nr:FAD-dependent oxidoreductase [Planctomycetota bacterium]